MADDHDKVAFRLATILQKLNQGEILVEKELAEEFNVSIRTIQRDLRERFVFLPLEQSKSGYQLNPTFLGKFEIEDINRFARFASIQDLFGKIDQDFFQKYLTDSITIKTFAAEPIATKLKEFDGIHQAIQQHCLLSFTYQKVNRQDGKGAIFIVEPYKLVNKNGIWYLIAIHDDRIKVFSVARIRKVQVEQSQFKPDIQISKRINSTDSIYFEDTLDEVMLKIHANVSVYFKRRSLLPNQEIIKELLDGTLIVMCRNVHEQEILPLVRYWLPNIEIVAPDNLKQQLTQQLEQYLSNPICNDPITIQ